MAAAQWGRHSIGVEIDKKFFDLAVKRLEEESRQLFGNVSMEISDR